MLENFDKNKNPFKVPENYFGDFNADIMDKLPQKEMNKAKIVPLWKKIVPWTAVAAVFCGILFMTGVFKFNRSTIPGQNAFADKESVIVSGIASSMEEDYYLFLEDEVADSKYREILFSN